MDIAIYAFDGVTMFHLAAPEMVFGEVARLAPEAGWRTTLWSDEPGDVEVSEGYRIGPVAGPDVADDADMIVIPSWPEHLPPITDDLGDLLRRAHRRGATIVGLCLGSVAVADAGLLRGRSAVTHWAAIEELRARHPDVSVDSGGLYVDHGDVLTAAGTASALDACLHLVRSHLGAREANRVARRLVVAPHRDGGQAQYVERPLPPATGADPMSAVCHWALAHLSEPLSVDRMAAQAQMSRRHFVRKFQEANGIAPARWVVLQRLESARTLLESNDWDIDRVAHTCGFASVVTFRQNFAAHFATTPSAYRRRFRTTGEVSHV